ncbi:Cytochrome c553 [Roseateles sp. YR242]|uniref:c-type cytochrome n=1 Tax=Roseateles sp. YR242 TaxID=1855305 RepID=UPI0008BA324D|nr:cytochrome c [Roseateles sp. YR242]SEK23621.1 Cytochrome c553 [Roseateles sp. YR242]
MDARLFSWSNRWFRRSVGGLVAFTVAAALIGFIALPSVQADYSVGGLWQAICRAAGVPNSWATPGGGDVPPRPLATKVVLDRGMTRVEQAASVGRGATLALNCTMCHGAQGASVSNSPNLAGQYPEVVIKQLHDYREGGRINAVMQSLARGLSDQDIRDLAAYYASLPKARTSPTTYDETLPALVRVGDPIRNIAPCISCHGGVDQKLGTPWIEGMPKAYLVLQLDLFRSGQRANDAHGQMRNMARAMTAAEVQEVAEFYARKVSAEGGH